MKKLYYKFKYWLLVTYTNRDMSIHYLKDLEYKAGYIGEKGEPLVCFNCGHKDFIIGENYSEGGYGLIEYEMLCKKCNKRVGYWAYGNWTT